ncbi:MAG TPA: heterodisulfide reductase-related iron-sulfur binding cluster [Alphaproteobacteria bacterium]|nr:heterodisulfide reductase-related iron-sulfur binding cluster [Alphaproteobacteria bacterium]
MEQDKSGAPFRHPIDWRREGFYDRAALDAESRRIFDVCHGCRRCFNLCDSFPRLFELIDESKTGELDSVESKGFARVVEACTLCDMCFMVKCPYVPPHEFNIDFPHLMLRHRALALREGQLGFAERRLAETEANGRLARHLAPLANWATRKSNRPTRTLLRWLAGIHPDARLPRYESRTFLARAREEAIAVNTKAPAFGRKAALFATCFLNYNDTAIGEAARRVLAHNGIETEVFFPACCGMPKLEQGDLKTTASRARTIAGAALAYVDKGYAIIAPVPSCALMMKFEWPLILPEDDAVKRLADQVFDLSEYVVDIARNEGLAPGLKPLPGGITAQVPCHERAQNMGAKSAEMLRLIPETELAVIERCSGHGGTFGVKAATHEVAVRVGKPVARQALERASAYVASACPLAAGHLVEGMDKLESEPGRGPAPPRAGRAHHPIELMALSYGFGDEAAP